METLEHLPAPKELETLPEHASGRMRFSQVTRPFLALLLGEWLRAYRRPLLLLVPEAGDARTFLSDFTCFHPGVTAHLLMEPNPYAEREPARAAALEHLMNRAEGLVATTLWGAASPQPRPRVLTLQIGDHIASWDVFVQDLVEAGYLRSDFPLSEGEFTLRGDTLVIRGSACTHRLTFFGRNLDEIAVEGRAGPAPNIVRLPDLSIPRRPAEFLWTWLPPEITVATHDLDAAFPLYENFHATHDDRDDWLPPDRMREVLQQKESYAFSSFTDDTEAIRWGVRPVSMSFPDDSLFDSFSRKLRQKGVRIIAVTKPRLHRGSLDGRRPDDLEVWPGNLSEGFYSPASSLLVLNDEDLKRQALHEPTLEKLSSIADLQEGDLVVHEAHGIAVFRGLTRKAAGGDERDYLLLEFRDGDRLYVPLEQLQRVHRYMGIGDSLPLLSALGGQRWNLQKAAVRRAATHYAQELYNLYRQRLDARKRPFGPDSDWQALLEESFPHPETPDQLRIQLEIKKDLESEELMDRLVCGDVGFGKTELALRAAFKAVMDGRQVAVLVPTTLLAYQHYLTFKHRLAPFPIEVEVLSRFKSPREIRRILQRLAEGDLHVILGTHRLLQKDVQFKNLGLLVIDEEQRFGVAHKEQIKFLQRRVDVLTLTATPIPRTLYMSLIALKPVSYLRTPPLNRIPVVTSVARFDPDKVRAAIRRELDRGGRVFYLHNRVDTIKGTADEVRAAFPGVQVEVAHGQMRPRALEKALVDFLEERTRILVCTTLIENGIDIPNADTLIVEEAENFGLADLHQLRGRVGRGERQAFAYFLFSKHVPAAPGARDRMAAIGTFSYLGAGFDLAQRDLEIRGAGTLLGKHQHGFAAHVGFYLYTQLLADEIAGLLKKPVARRRSTLLSLPVNAYIPEAFIPDPKQRLGYYEALMAAAREEDLESARRELTQLKGDLPQPLLHFLDLALLKMLAEGLEFQRVGYHARSGRLLLDTERKDWLDYAAERHWAVEPLKKGWRLSVSVGRLAPVAVLQRGLELLKELSTSLEGSPAGAERLRE